MQVKAKTLRELAGAELEQKLRDLRKEQFELRKVKVAGKLENPLRLRLLRREVARLLTVMKEPAVTKQ
jgi:large subunit ribosomal protein L29